MKTIIAVIALVLLASSADARTRVRVHPSQRPIVAHPYAVEYVLSYMLCSFHVFSIGPDARPGQIGSCADFFNIRRPQPKRFG